MKSIALIATRITLAAFLLGAMTNLALAGTLQTRADGVTVVHLDEYNGYFAAEETVASLKAGEYEFVVTNRAEKLVGFQIQDLSSRTNLDMFPLEPGETRIARVSIGEDGVRYRCPINPTPWYDLDVIK
jgi:hypothetical protein